MADFSKPYIKTLAKEGFYDNNPKDRGGETIFGLARNFTKDFEGWPYFDKKKKEDPKGFLEKLRTDSAFLLMVRNYYKKIYWDVFRGDEIGSQEVAEELYDTGVNCGPDFAARTLQEVLNVGNRDQKDYKDVKVDGIIGFETIEALHALLLKRSAEVVLKVLNQRQGARYFEICKTNPGQEEFFWGWVGNRT